MSVMTEEKAQARMEARLAAKKAKAAAAKSAKKAAKKVAPKPKAPVKSKAKPVDKPAKKAAKAKKLTKAELAKARVETLPKSAVQIKGNQAPGLELANALQRGFDFLNDKLFDGKCEPCVVVPSRLKRSLGHFAWVQWHAADDADTKVHEIGIDTRRLEKAGAGVKEVLSTIAHEMAHEMVYQLDKAEAEANGKEFRPKTTHCQTWAELMKKIGLKPMAVVDGAASEDKETGPNATHRIMPGEAFCKAADELIAEGYTIPWKADSMFYDENDRPINIVVGPGGVLVPGKRERSTAPKKKAGGKFKYEADCGTAMWGKPGIKANCGCGCNSAFNQLDKAE